MVYYRSKKREITIYGFTIKCSGIVINDVRKRKFSEKEPIYKLFNMIEFLKAHGAEHIEIELGPVEERR